jgi:cystathionine beta-lyase
VAALAAEHGVGVIVDEIHALLVPAGGAEFTPYLAVDEAGIVVTSASKVYNMAGIKAAVMIAGEASRETLGQLPESVKYGASTFGIRAHVAAWRGGDEWLDAVNANIASNAAYLGELLADRIPEIGYRPPASTYLAWLDCRALGLGDDPAAVFLERGRVALNGGLPFGIGGEGFVRLNLAASRSTLREAVDRMARALDR